MIGDRRPGLIVMRRARPEDAELLLDFLVADARVVGDAPFTGDTQLLKNLAGASEREPVRSIQRCGDVLNDPPILPRLAGAIDGFVDLDDAPLDLRDDAFVFLLK